MDGTLFVSCDHGLEDWRSYDGNKNFPPNNETDADIRDSNKRNFDTSDDETREESSDDRNGHSKLLSLAINDNNDTSEAFHILSKKGF